MKEAKLKRPFADTVTNTEATHTQSIQSDDSRPFCIAEVAVPLDIDNTFSYLVPERLIDNIKHGVRLFVPFGRRKITAYLLGYRFAKESEPLKEILEILDDEPLWTEKDLVFLRWISGYYLHPLGKVLKAALPNGINVQSRTNAEGEGVTGGKKVLREKVFSPTEADRSAFKLKEKNQNILNFLCQNAETSQKELRKMFGECGQNLKRLVELGLIQKNEREVYRDPFAGYSVTKDSPKLLMQHQSEVLAAIIDAADSRTFSPFLLHGITGSGKTEVYLQAISHILERGDNALVLVPEISLTPLLVQRFRARFQEGIAVLHSGLSDGERYDEWRRIRRSEVRIVIGARSAIFAPLQQIGIIVVDEEHETSFKQSEGLRYNARDLSLVLGRQENAVVLLGSATPLVTSRFAAQQGKLGYLHLPLRVGSSSLPETTVITTKMTPETPISATLIQSLSDNLERGEQSLVFLNRRGFSSCLICNDCGADLQCPNCSVSLTYHRQRLKSICHYCDYQVPFPSVCHSCGSTDMKEMGVGTERVEHELRTIFPKARIARMDSDTTCGKGAHALILNKVESGEIDILVGTQMIAKGHDFPGVTLVGVLQAEGSLYLPDFRAAERTFQLLSQVIGRAGRGYLPGRVLIQAMNPGHYALETAACHDFEDFYKQELEFRQELNYPPFGFLVAIKFSATSESALIAVSESSAKLLSALKSSLMLRTEILGPAPAPIYRMRGRFRIQILLKDTNRVALRKILTAYLADRPVQSAVRETVDVDPVDLL